MFPEVDSSSGVFCDDVEDDRVNSDDSSTSMLPLTSEMDSLLYNTELDVLNLPVDWQNELARLDLDWLVSENEDLFSIDDVVQTTATSNRQQHVDAVVADVNAVLLQQHSSSKSAPMTSEDVGIQPDGLADSYSTPEVNKIVASGTCWLVDSFDDLCEVFSL